MKITKTYLKQLIKEELAKMEEADTPEPEPEPKDGWELAQYQYKHLKCDEALKNDWTREWDPRKNDWAYSDNRVKDERFDKCQNLLQYLKDIGVFSDVWR